MTVGALISSYQKKCVRARVVLMTSHGIDYNDDVCLNKFLPRPISQMQFNQYSADYIALIYIPRPSISQRDTVLLSLPGTAFYGQLG